MTSALTSPHFSAWGWEAYLTNPPEGALERDMEKRSASLFPISGIGYAVLRVQFAHENNLPNKKIHYLRAATDCIPFVNLFVDIGVTIHDAVQESRHQYAAIKV